MPSSLGVWKKWHLLFVCFLVSLQGLQKLQNSILSLRANPPIKVKWPFEIFWTSVCLLIRVCSSESAILISWKKVSQIQKIGSKLWFMKRRIYLNIEINISKFIPSNILSSSQNIWRKHSHWLIGTESICFFVRLLFRCLRPFSGFYLVKDPPL